MRKKATINKITVTAERKQNRCLSCGKTENMKNRRYCSILCRQKLRQKLNTRSGLLQALNTRYATFYFSDTLITMDVVPHGSKEIFKFTHPRMTGHKPGDDFSKLTNILGSAWWEEEKRTNRKYLASRRVMEFATRHPGSSLSFRPQKMTMPAVEKKYLECLAIDKLQLSSPDLRRIIKNAYRQQAKIHHPDIGGSAATFRKTHEAYKELLLWAENPNFIKRRGFPDKWFYDGENKRWVQPMPVTK
jgi:hypothetical protein